MIINLEHFVKAETPQWRRLDDVLQRMAADPWRRPALEEARELDRLYRRASADLARIATFSAEPDTRRYLENLVARAYAEIYSAPGERGRFRVRRWLAVELPQAFRRHVGLFWLAVTLTGVGAASGGLAMAFDPDAKPVLMPYSHLQESPAERVAQEESAREDRLSGHKATFSGQLMTHNTRVTLLVMALGITCGVGTVILVFYNGVILGAVIMDYLLGGQGVFLAGWLLPHGVVEIPAMLVGAQAGFVLAQALLGRGTRENLADRLRRATPDVVTLSFGAALLLVWAGVVESFLSQYHEPVIPYLAKIAFGLLEAVVLAYYFMRAGRRADRNGPLTEAASP
ncbi:MAG: hypothetical protein A3G75_01915 [Verrucomicrobia bacterium RIFCSPLOWO2_12_FULL_64_8]|nr:MAG: hypothetical protein A3G75_01915 [Verrucomicrobia bacterium RIFCSPLOWO2_12_FULL_64_8]